MEHLWHYQIQKYLHDLPAVCAFNSTLANTSLHAPLAEYAAAKQAAHPTLRPPAESTFLLKYPRADCKLSYTLASSACGMSNTLSELAAHPVLGYSSETKSSDPKAEEVAHLWAIIGTAD